MSIFYAKLVVSEELIPIAVKKAKIVYNFGRSECNRVKVSGTAYFHCCFHSYD